MAGPIERYKRETYTIKQRSSIVDGKPTFSEISARGLSLDLSKDEVSKYGNVARGRVFFVAPLDSTPTMPCKIVFDSVEYDVQSIEVLKTLRGALWGYKLVAFGG